MTNSYLYFFSCVFCVLLVNSAHAEQYTIENEITVGAGNSVYLLVDELPASSIVGVLENNNVLYSQNLGLRRGLGAFIYLDSQETPRDIKIKVQYKFGGLPDKPYNIQLLKPPKNEGARDALRDYSKLLLDSPSSIDELTARIEKIITKLDRKTISSVHARTFLLDKLFEAGKYTEVLAIATRFLTQESKQKSILTRFESLQIREARLRSEQALDFYSASYNEYKILVEDLAEFELSGSFYQQLVVQDFVATYGNLVLQHARQKDDVNNTRKHLGAEIIRRAINRVIDLEDELAVAEYKNYLWSYYFMVGEFELSEQVLEEAVTVMENYSAKSQLVDIYYNFSVFLQLRGDFSGALKYLQLVLKDEQQHSEAVRADLLLNISEFASRAGSYSIAIVNAEKAISIYSRIGNLLAVGKSALVAGKAQRERNNHEEAIASHKLAVIALSGNSQQTTESRNLLLDARIELSVSLISSGDSRAAKMELDRINQLIASSSKSELYKEALLLVELELARLILSVATSDKEGYELYSDNLRQLFDSQKSTNAYAVEQLRFFEQILKWQKSNNLVNEMQQTIIETVKLVDRVRLGFDTKVLGPAWSSKVTKVFELYTSTIANFALEGGHQDTLEDLFMFLEATQSVSFRQNRANVENQVQRLDTSDLQDKELALITTKSEFQRNEAMQQMTEIQMKNLNDPQSTFKSSLSAVLVKDVQGWLKEDELFVSYTVMPSFSIGYVVFDDDWYVVRLPGREQLAVAVANFNQAVLKKSTSGVIQSKELLSMLQLPLSNQKFRRLTLRLDGPLWSIPFDALNQSDTGNKYQPLIKSHEIMMTHSASEYFNARPYKVDLAERYDIAVFADPVFDNTELSYQESDTNPSDQFRNWTEGLSRLPWTAQESESIQQTFFNKRLYSVTGHQATASELLSPKMLDAKLLHIASHGYFSEEIPDVVGIATSYVKGNSSSGFVSLNQLSSSPIRANLVVISGCETSLGQELAGEGLNGLTRGVLGQGAGSVIGTLWSIPDKPSAEFMKFFYESLKESNGNAVSSLANAKRRFLIETDYKAPYYWAGFTLTGADRERARNVFIH